MTPDKFATCLLLLALASPCTAELLAQCRLPETDPVKPGAVVWHTLRIESAPWSATMDGVRQPLREPRTDVIQPPGNDVHKESLAETLLKLARQTYEMLDTLPEPLPRVLTDALLPPDALQLDKVHHVRTLEIKPGKFGEGVFMEAFDNDNQKLWQGLSVGLAFFARCDNP